MDHTRQEQRCDVLILGMSCASCETYIERQFIKLGGIHKVVIDRATGKAELSYTKQPSIESLQAAIASRGYYVEQWREPKQAARSQARVGPSPHRETMLIALLVLIAYAVLNALQLLPQVSLSDSMSYGFIFLIGLVAAVSTCLAVTGGLILALAAKQSAEGTSQSRQHTIRFHLLFNLGRVLSYTVFGAVIGALGSVITLSLQMNGVLTLLVSVVMLLLGFQILKLFPALTRFQPRMPKALGHYVHELADGEHKAGPLLLGGATFFLPCGFTQALQLYVMSQGSWQVGALTMLAFALGTLPALLSVGAISRLVQGTAQRLFLKGAGVIIVLLGLFNLQNGLALTGIDLSALLPASQPAPAAVSDAPAPIVNGTQIVQMKVEGLRYTPSRFRVVEGVPVEWQIDGRAAAGCAQVVMVPELGMTIALSSNEIKTVSFTPRQQGTITFSCPMGMTTRGAAIEVLPAAGRAG